MTQNFFFRNSATLRRRLEVSSWLALRAVAQSARSVQSVAAQSEARRDKSAMPILNEKFSSAKAGGQLHEWEEKKNSRPSKSERASQVPAPSVNTSAEAEPKVTHSGACALRELQVQCKQVLASTLCLVAKALANPSLNRTLHSVPAFALANTLAQIPSHCSGPVSSNVSQHH